MAKRTTSKASAKGSASNSVRKTKKKVAAKRTVGASTAAVGKATKRRSVASTKAPVVKANKRASVKKSKKRTTTTTRSKVKGATLSDASSQDPIQFPEQEKLPKSQLTAKERREFRGLLLRKRVELVGDVQGLGGETLHGSSRGSGDRSAMPIHMADLGTDNWEQEFTLDLLASEQALVRQIDDALSRIADKTYGVCLATHKQISMARLRAKPWAKYCIEYARAREEGRAL